MAAPISSLARTSRLFTLRIRPTGLVYSKPSVPMRHSSAVGYSLNYKEYGDPSVVLQKEEFAIPTKLKNSEVLVEILAAPINPADINTLQGVYAIKPPLPACGGFEGVGKIIKVANDVTDLQIGDWVIPTEVENGGTWRTHTVWNQEILKKIPNDIPVLSAATISVNPCTAYRMLHDFVKLQPGDTIIQNGANSGVGQAAIQIARHLKIGTINVVRSRPEIEELKKQLKQMGADHVVTEEELRSQEFAATLKKLPKPKLALNCVGGKSATELLRVLDHCGIMATYGGMSRQPVVVATSALIFKDIQVRGFWMTNWKKKNSQSPEVDKMIDFLCDMSRKGTLLPPLCNIVSLDNYKIAVAEAMKGFVGKKQIFVMKK